MDLEKLSQEDYDKVLRKSIKIIFISFSLYLIQLGFVIFQLCNKIFTIWNIIPLVMVVVIIVFNIINNKRLLKEKVLDQFENGSPTEYSGKKVVNSRRKTNLIFDCTKPIKKTDVIVRVVFLIILLVIAGIFGFLYKDKKDNYNVVTATIVEQKIEKGDKKYKETVKIDEYGKEVSTTYTTIKYDTIVEYELDDVKYRTIIPLEMVKVSKLKICVNDEGEFKKVYNTNIFLYTAIVCIVTSVLILFSLLFKYPVEFFVFIMIAAIGVVVIFVINLGCFSNILYNDLTSFGLFFVLTGLMGMVGAILSKKMIKPIEPKIENSEIENM